MKFAKGFAIGLIAWILVYILATLSNAQTPDVLRSHVEYLAADGLAGRAMGSDGLKQSQQYVTQHLKDAGIPVSTQSVGSCNSQSCDKCGKCSNIIGVIKGTQPETYIVVGAHLDHLGVNRNGQVMNGADDNASGSAAILELAKRVNKAKPIRSVVFVWFTGEEKGLYGSKAFVKDPFNSKLPVFMLNLDMVGHLKDKLNRHETTDGNLARLFKKYDFAERITWRGSTMPSDNIPFHQAGVSTIFLITGDHALYHTSSDDSNTLDYQGLAKICNYAYDIIIQVAGERRNYDLGGGE